MMVKLVKILILEITKSLVIAYCDGMPETYENMKLIFDRLNLETVMHSLACNLKMLNLLLGMSLQQDLNCSFL